MRIGQIIAEKRASLSFEFFPPKDDLGEEQLFEAVEELEPLAPTFVSVTYGAGGGTSKNTMHIVQRIKRETSLVPMPHLTCVDQSSNELKSLLEDYRRLGIENVLALRGDPPSGTEKFMPPVNGFCYAKDLVQLVASLSDFSIGVGVYPEGHPESPNLEMDMYYTKQKIDAGAEFAITQMFFDNRYFYDFLERAAKADIRIPIIVGILPIADINKIKKFCQRCKATLPEDIIEKFETVSRVDGEIEKVSVETATQQCADLVAHGVRCFHFYTLNQSNVVSQVVKNLGLHDLEPVSENASTS